MYLSLDGNFQLQLKAKRNDLEDIPLNGGKGFFMEDEPYKTYLTKVDSSSNIKHSVSAEIYAYMFIFKTSTCAHLSTVRLQDTNKFSCCEVSGVVVVQCAHHGFFFPQGTVDLKKGEAFASADYTLAYAFKNIVFEEAVFSHYRTLPQHDMMGIIQKIEGAIPSMHIHNHLEDCQAHWALKYLKYSSETYGENIESSWVKQNQSAGSTKEQNPGHQHDSLDGYFNHWNWVKLQWI
ncbi:hypothetical protein AX16_010570, partial [Volvariella volvacea WC 439]